MLASEFGEWTSGTGFRTFASHVSPQLKVEQYFIFRVQCKRPGFDEVFSILSLFEESIQWPPTEGTDLFARYVLFTAHVRAFQRVVGARVPVIDQLLLANFFLAVFACYDAFLTVVPGMMFQKTTFHHHAATFRALHQSVIAFADVALNVYCCAYFLVGNE